MSHKYVESELGMTGDEKRGIVMYVEGLAGWSLVKCECVCVDF